MLPAIIEIHQALLKAGYAEEQADELAARLMEEEAADYVKFIHAYKENDELVKQILN